VENDGKGDFIIFCLQGYLPETILGGEKYHVEQTHLSADALSIL
jgi:hypothetical protein